MVDGIPQQCCLAHARRANDGDESRGRFIGDSVDEGDVEALLFDLGGHRESGWRDRDGTSGIWLSVHRGSARPVSQACRGWRTQRPWDFVLSQCECMECMKGEMEYGPFEGCAFFSLDFLDARCGLCACPSILEGGSGGSRFRSTRNPSRDSRSRLHPIHGPKLQKFLGGRKRGLIDKHGRWVPA